jgi:hypothetical protein
MYTAGMGSNEASMPSKDEIREALQSRLGPCPMCAGTEWAADRLAVALPALETEPDGGLKFITELDSDDPSTGGFNGVTALPVVCGGCGYIALFHLDKLLGRGPNAGG